MPIKKYRDEEQQKEEQDAEGHGRWSGREDDASEESTNEDDSGEQDAQGHDYRNG